MCSNIEEYMCEDLVDMMRSLFCKGKVMKDYKVVGNSEGTTIVLHLCKPGNVTPRFPLGKSHGRQHRDQARYGQYMSSTSQYSPVLLGQTCNSEVGQQHLRSDTHVNRDVDEGHVKPSQNQFNVDQTVVDISANATPDVEVAVVVYDEVLPEQYIHFEDEDKVLDSRNDDLQTMYISDEDQLTKAKMEERNDTLLNVVQDRRNTRNHLIGETDDFVMVYDVANDKDIFLGKWQIDNPNLQIAKHLLSKWKHVDQSLESEVEVLDDIRSYRVGSVQAGVLKLSNT